MATKKLLFRIREDQARCLVDVVDAATSMISYECKPSTSSPVKELAGKLAVDRALDAIQAIRLKLGESDG